MMRRVILVLLLLAVAACNAPTETDGGMGGTGAPVMQAPVMSSVDQVICHGSQFCKMTRIA